MTRTTCNTGSGIRYDFYTEQLCKAADDAPFEMVEEFHGHVFLPFQLVPEPAKLTKQVIVNLKVHIINSHQV